MVTIFTITNKPTNASVTKYGFILGRNAASTCNRVHTFRCNVSTVRQTDGIYLQDVQQFFQLAKCIASVKPHLIQTIYCAALPYTNQTVYNTVQVHGAPSTLYVRVTLYWGYWIVL